MHQESMMQCPNILILPFTNPKNRVAHNSQIYTTASVGIQNLIRFQNNDFNLKILLL